MITGPSGKVFELREQHGGDDETLSQLGLGNGKELTVINNFLTGVIQSIDDKKPVMIDDIKSLGLRDKYAILIHSRIFSLGESLKFDYSWDVNKPPSEYSEDLGIFVWDYDTDFPEEGHPSYHHQRIKPLPTDGFINIETPNKKFRMIHMTGIGEELLHTTTNATVNTELIARDLEISTEKGWEKVINFSQVSSRDLVHIRRAAELHDPIPSATVSIENPFSGEVESVPLLAIKDFFFPTLL